jgi:hypothetical protein
MTLLSQNGYPVIESARTAGPHPRLRTFNIPGVKRTLNLRDGSVGFLLVHLALWWHETIHRLDTGTWDEWGWAVRPVRGQSSGYSNHAAGCACDLDATMHPRGVSIFKTFSLKQIALIHARLVVYRGCLRWGGDYQHSPQDGMHFEVVRNMAAVEKNARRLMKTPRGKRILAANPGLQAVILS